ncbi:unnamed protein product [Merluccius merluccius]
MRRRRRVSASVRVRVRTPSARRVWRAAEEQEKKKEQKEEENEEEEDNLRSGSCVPVCIGGVWVWDEVWVRVGEGGGVSLQKDSLRAKHLKLQHASPHALTCNLNHEATPTFAGMRRRRVSASVRVRVRTPSARRVWRAAEEQEKKKEQKEEENEEEEDNLRSGSFLRLVLYRLPFFSPL